MNNNKLIFVGIVIVSFFIVFMVAISFSKNNNKPKQEDKNILYSWKVYKFDYTPEKSNSSKTYIMTDFTYNFYKDKLMVCSDELNKCEKCEYTKDEDSITFNNENTTFAPFNGIYYIKRVNGDVLLEKNFPSGKSAVYYFKET